MATNYYTSLFYSDSVEAESLLSGHFLPLQQTQLSHLLANCSDDEIFHSLKGMSPYKSLGPDGFQACFYQKNWATTGPSIIALAQSVMAGGELPPKLVEVLLVLVPNIDNPSLLTHFRPISLCDVLYKIIT